MTLLTEIDAFLAEASMSPTAFGQRALNDPAFVPNLRAGRDPKWSTVERVREFMREHRATAPSPEAA